MFQDAVGAVMPKPTIDSPVRREDLKGSLANAPSVLITVLPLTNLSVGKEGHFLCHLVAWIKNEVEATLICDEALYGAAVNLPTERPH